MEKIDTKKVCIDEIPKRPYQRNGYIQNDFSIEIDGSKCDVTIFANQPLYIGKNKDRFRLAEKGISDLMGYGKLRVEEIIFHNFRIDETFSKRLNSLLERLTT